MYRRMPCTQFKKFMDKAEGPLVVSIIKYANNSNVGMKYGQQEGSWGSAQPPNYGSPSKPT